MVKKTSKNAKSDKVPPTYRNIRTGPWGIQTTTKAEASLK